jgi:hypothetical protein
MPTVSANADHLPDIHRATLAPGPVAGDGDLERTQRLLGRARIDRAAEDEIDERFGLSDEGGVEAVEEAWVWVSRGRGCLWFD